MVFKLPSARCLSKASRDGALSENMANADINASLKGISTSSTRSSALVAKCSRSKRKSASAQRYLRPFGTTMDIATLNLTSSTCDIVPMRAVLWHACLRKVRWDTGVVTRIYRPPGIAGRLPFFSPQNQGVLADYLAYLRARHYAPAMQEGIIRALKSFAVLMPEARRATLSHDLLQTTASD